LIEKQTITAEIVTPCFLGGTKETAEWRAASIRGQLRWWFRAVAGGAWKGDLDKVRTAEDLLFGSTDRGSLLRVRTFEAPAPLPKGSQFGLSLPAAEIARLWGDQSPATQQRLRLTPDTSNPIHYLGFGPIKGRQTERPCLPAGKPVEFELVWMGKADEKLLELFDHALWAWLHLGGIGGRNRRGFGSLQQTPVPADRESFKARVRALLAIGKEAGSISPEWTCFTARSRVFVAREGYGSWVEAMNRLGAWMIGFRRRYGFPGESRPGLADRDYTWATENGRMRHDSQRQIPDRAGFGLPIHFGQQETVTWDAAGEEGDARRASPLLLHVARFGSSWVPVLTHLPAAFLPAGKSLRFKRRPFKTQAPAARHLDVIDRFLDDLAGKAKIVEVV
jgi:CRISPR-associated protein Cmr1